MVEVYIYVPAEKTENAVECGIKLSEWYSREINFEGEKKKCITALLNPRDDHEKYMSPTYRCLKLEMQPKYCFVADSLLYMAGISYPKVMDMYYRSVTPIEQYAFGNFRLPECLITSTVIGEHISVLSRGLDTPILYNNSQDLYFNNILEGLREAHDDLNDTLLYHFFRNLCDEGKVTGIEDTASGLAVFKDNRDDRTYTLRIPDMEKY